MRVSETGKAAPAFAGGGSPKSSCLSANTFTYNPKTTTDQARLHLHYLARRLHKLGPKPLFHFLTDIEAGKAFRASLEEYAALPRDFIVALGGDQLPPALHAVDGSAHP
jgi:hypothetical protein